MEIFFPIFQFGCFVACVGVIDLSLFKGVSRNGPPDAVIKISSISLSLKSFVKLKIEKCSESTGRILVLYFKDKL